MLLRYLKEGRYSNLTVIDERIATKNLTPGKSVYGEKLVKINNEEYRLWNPNRSKLAAAIYNGLKELPLKEDSKVLYLGAASGTTASHISDIAAQGLVFCIEFSPRVFRELVEICEYRKNMIPILADASKPQSYISMVEKCDFVYADIAQPTQTEILIENSKFYLKPGSWAAIAIKARSIDVAEDPDKIFKQEIAKLKNEFEILDVVQLAPYEKDHALVLGKK